VEPILGVWGGLYLDRTIISQSALQPYVTDAMNELEFLMGDSSTTYGKQRIAFGYPNPFPVKYVEVGNEDNLNNGQSSYNSYRFMMFYNAIKAKYPAMVVIASTPALNPQPGNSALDFHQYTVCAAQTRHSPSRMRREIHER
jgi:alpha-L-arabinofuranosidase